MAFLVLKILLLLKFGSISLLENDFWTMYSPWSSKNVINHNVLKKFMQVGIDITYMQNNFGGVAFLISKILLPLKNGQISLLDHGL